MKRWLRFPGDAAWLVRLAAVCVLAVIVWQLAATWQAAMAEDPPQVPATAEPPQAAVPPGNPLAPGCMKLFATRSSPACGSGTLKTGSIAGSTIWRRDWIVPPASTQGRGHRQLPPELVRPPDAPRAGARRRRRRSSRERCTGTSAAITWGCTAPWPRPGRRWTSGRRSRVASTRRPLPRRRC